MKYCIFIFSCFLISCSSNQYEISVQSDLVENFKFGSVELKRNIPDGKYFVTISDVCNNKDTLLIAEVENDLREGKWIYFDQLLSFDSCNSEIELRQIDSYKNGYLLRSEVHTGSGIMTSNYQPYQKKHNGDRITIDHIYENGTRRIDSFRNENHASSFDFGKDGNLETKTESINDTFFVQQYFPSGKISDEYKLVRIFIDDQAYEVYDGKATTWNEKGDVIKIENYNMGKVIKE